jgi:hypothetical protein
LQGLQQGNVFGDVVVLPANPPGDADSAIRAALNHDANTGRPRISQGTAIHVGYEVQHAASAVINMRQKSFLRQVVYSERLQRGLNAVE